MRKGLNERKAFKTCRGSEESAKGSGGDKNYLKDLTMNKFFGHLKTITRHKRLVRRFCFKCGLYRQGICHDLSKYTPTEFLAGVKYFSGVRSPNVDERRDKGYSAAWLHHKGRNRHHWEYWTDYKGKEGIQPVEMPAKYVAEMCCDRIAACRVYHGKEYRQTDALEYFSRSKTAPLLMHPNSAALLRKWLTICAEQGEQAVFDEIKRTLREEKNNCGE